MSIRIGLGVANFSFSGPAAFWRWVDYCDESAIDSLWFSERLVSKHAQLEPLTAIAAVAGRTSSLKFGMNATVLPFRDPLMLAKELATIDYLSEGRLLPVYGVGAETAPEFRATGRSPEGRGKLSDEIIQIVTRLCAEDDVTFEGKHFQYHNVSIAPKPVQQPLPVWIGGSSPAAIRRTATYGDGWLAGLQSAAQVRPVVAAIRDASAKAGRPLDPDHYGAGFTYRFGSPEEDIVQRSVQAFARFGRGVEPSAIIAAGDGDTIIARCQEYIDAGISKFVLRPLAADDEDTMAQTRMLAEQVLPVVHAIPSPM